MSTRFSPEQKRSALEGVLDSNTFARADQLRRFLRYICEMEIAGRAQEITEYSIATEAMGRPRDYTPGDDSSVRSRAHALRQKLQELYETEQPEAPVRIELRKGSYIPSFAVPESPVRVPGTPAAGRVGERRRWWLSFTAGAVTAGVLAAAILLVWFRPGRSHAADPMLREAWGSMLDSGAEVTICVASAPALLLKSFREGTLPQIPHLLAAPAEVSDWYSGLRMMDGGGPLYMQTTMNALLVGDSLAAVRAVRLLGRTGASIQVLPEWGLRPLALRGRNVLLIGSPNYSPYAARILQSTPFSVRYDSVRREEVISDGSPQGGATQEFHPKWDKYREMTQVYGLLTVLPSLTTGEGREKTVVFSGITSAGPQAAMEFFASAPALAELRARFVKEGQAHLPPAYQVVVRCGVDRLLALTWSYEAHRLIKQPPVLE